MPLSISKLRKNLSNNRLSGLVRAMNGGSPAFNAPVVSQPNPMDLPENYGFNDLARYEEARRNQFGQDASNTILNERNRVASSLGDYGKKFFEQQNPAILEDLNSRGLLTSPSEVANSQTQALKEIELSNQNYLRDYDAAALSTNLQSRQDALDSSLDLRRGNLEAQLGIANSNREEALARDLGKQQSRNSLYGSLIGAGGSILGAKLMGGGSLFGGGTVATGGGAGFGGGGLFGGLGTVSANPLSAYGTSGGAGVGTTATGGLGASSILPLAVAGYGASQISAAGEKKYGTAGGIVANPIGYQINKAKEIVTNPGKALSKAFCFDPLTKIQMADGSEKMICDVRLTDKTKGGDVHSVRISKTTDGTLYDYEGITVTGSHAVLEDDVWIRVQDSTRAKPLSGPGLVVSLVTDQHRIFIKDIEFSDEHENDGYEHLTIDESLDELNKQIQEVSHAA